MPQYHKTLGVIDIGSNSVRMVIYDLTYRPAEKIFNEKIVCSLGRDLGTTGLLHPEAAEAAYNALRAYKILADIYSVLDLKIVGTAALRDAKDAASFIQRVQDDIGLTIRIISGDEEAAYAAQGVLNLELQADGVVADFGGGSLELARLNPQGVHDTISLPLGAYRVMAMTDSAEATIRAYIEPLVSRFGHLPALYAIGGSWRVLASAYMKHIGREAFLQGYRISTPKMIEFCNYINQLTDESLRAQFRMESHQARLAPVAAFTLKMTLSLLQPAEFVVSTAGIRDGIVHEFLLSQTKNQ